jgi:hypothetical protein
MSAAVDPAYRHYPNTPNFANASKRAGRRSSSIT